MSLTSADCRGCGACCFSAAEAYVRVTGQDWARLGAEAERWAHFLGHRAFMRMEGGHCAALRVVGTAAGEPAFLCSSTSSGRRSAAIWGRGSPECEAEIVRKVSGVTPPF